MGMAVGQLDHIFAVIAERLPLFRLDDNGPIGTVRLLKARMAVKPVGARLFDGKLIGECLARLDAIVTNGRHAVLLVGQDQAVPMHGGHDIKVIGHVDGDVLTFIETQDRARRGAVVADALLLKIAGVYGDFID